MQKLKDLARPKIGIGNYHRYSGSRELPLQERNGFFALTTIEPGLPVLPSSSPSYAALLSLDHFGNRILPLFADTNRYFVRVFGYLVTVGWATPRRAKPSQRE